MAALSAAGYAAKDYAGHSFRIGAATTTACQGVQGSLIKTLGHWESAAYMHYIRTAPEVLFRVAKTLIGVRDRSPSQILPLLHTILFYYNCVYNQP